jgi:hypothetical protein
MTTQYVSQQVGVADGTLNPAARADGRQVHARKRAFICSKVAAQAWAAGDKIYLCHKPGNEMVTEIRVTSDTSLATATIDIGTIATPAEYCTGKTLTVVDTPTLIGPKASGLAGGPIAEEDLYATIGVAGVAAGVNVTFEIATCGE